MLHCQHCKTWLHHDCIVADVQNRFVADAATPAPTTAPAAKRKSLVSAAIENTENTEIEPPKLTKAERANLEVRLVVEEGKQPEALVRDLRGPKAKKGRKSKGGAAEEGGGGRGGGARAGGEGTKGAVSLLSRSHLIDPRAVCVFIPASVSCWSSFFRRAIGRVVGACWNLIDYICFPCDISCPPLILSHRSPSSPGHVTSKFTSDITMHARALACFCPTKLRPAPDTSPAPSPPPHPNNHPILHPPIPPQCPPPPLPPTQSSAA